MNATETWLACGIILSLTLWTILLLIVIHTHHDHVMDMNRIADLEDDAYDARKLVGTLETLVRNLDVSKWQAVRTEIGELRQQMNAHIRTTSEPMRVLYAEDDADARHAFIEEQENCATVHPGMSHSDYVQEFVRP